MKKGLFKKVVAGVLISVFALGLVSCANKDEKAAEKASAVDRIKKAGKLVLGTSADYPPYEFHKSVNGKDTIIGFDIEIAREIAKSLGVELEISDMKFDGLLAALKTGKVDMIISGMNPTEERKKSVDFSKVYYNANQFVVVRAEDKDKVKSLVDLNGKKIGVQKATVQESLAKDQIKDAQLKSLGKIPDIVLELRNKKVDAAVIEGPVAKFYTDKNKDLVITDAAFSVKEDEKGSAIAIQKGSDDFLKIVNDTLDRLIKEGKIEKFVIEATNQVE
ncbi:amino acid ABC transporter [Clostridium polyendosporum]|uniref:Amino acid ABC transporter n=1 Tax=Clostridium polyendosporum TaxID=69208 RepID=A0A919VGM0_9CLOT|nr:ABC transporter substrate-binding protein [Clostridium polyendosporum]GIM28771.1 amino acid ABC transporter [Clostridium polyendosporum]